MKYTDEQVPKFIMKPFNKITNPVQTPGVEKLFEKLKIEKKKEYEMNQQKQKMYHQQKLQQIQQMLKQKQTHIKEEQKLELFPPKRNFYQ